MTAPQHSGPSPYDLIRIASMLNGSDALRRGDSDNASEECLARALQLWKLSEGVIARGGSQDEIDGSELRKMAEEIDATNALLAYSPDEMVSWSDPRLIAAMGESEKYPNASPKEHAERLHDRFRKRMKTLSREGEVRSRSEGIRLQLALDILQAARKPGPVLKPEENRPETLEVIPEMTPEARKVGE